LGNFARALHHLDMKDVKRRHLKELAVRKIKDEQDQKEEKIIQEIAKKHKSDWRKELEEDFTVVSNGPTNSATQTFQHVSGQNFSFSGIGGQEGHPSSVTVFGDDIPAPNYNQLALAGYVKPLGNVLKRKELEDTNSKLDASQEFAKKVGADVMMNARVEDAVKEIKEKAKKVRDLTNRITELRKLAERQSKKISKMRDDGLKKIDAKYDERQKVRDRMVRKFEASFPSLRYTISGAMQITDKADSDRYYAEQDAFYAKVDATWDAMTKKIDAERKTFLEKMDKLYGSTVGQYNQEIFNISQYERPKAEAEYRDALDRHNLQRPSYYDDDGMFDAFSNALDALAEAIANKSGVGVSKDMFDYYLDNWMKNPTNERLNLNNIFKPHLNTLKGYMSEIESQIRLFQSTGSSPEEIQRHINKYWDSTITRQMPTDLRNSLGNGSQLNYENWLKTGNWEISKNFVFTEPKDFQGRFGGPEILARILKQAPALYARYKSLLGGKGINLEQYTNKPMKYKVTIDGNKTKSTNKTINKIKSMSKERAARKALSLDQPVVGSPKKSKKKKG
jgi:archaellum component FlaC